MRPEHDETDDSTWSHKARRPGANPLGNNFYSASEIKAFECLNFKFRIIRNATSCEK